MRMKAPDGSEWKSKETDWGWGTRVKQRAAPGRNAAPIVPGRDVWKTEMAHLSWKEWLVNQSEIPRPLTCRDDHSALVCGHVGGWHVLLLHVAAVAHPHSVRAAHHLPTFAHTAFIGRVPVGGEDKSFC